MTAAKEAGDRFRFKHRVCFKKCGLWQGKGGFCPAAKENIEYCLELEKKLADSRDYRNLQTLSEWIEVLSEDYGFVMFVPSEALIEEGRKLLETTRYDCYQIAEKLLERVKNETSEKSISKTT